MSAHPTSRLRRWLKHLGSSITDTFRAAAGITTASKSEDTQTALSVSAEPAEPAELYSPLQLALITSSLRKPISRTAEALQGSRIRLPLWSNLIVRPIIRTDQGDAWLCAVLARDIDQETGEIIWLENNADPALIVPTDALIRGELIDDDVEVKNPITVTATATTAAPTARSTPHHENTKDHTVTSASRKLWLDTSGHPVITTTPNGEANARRWGWTPAEAVPSTPTDTTKIYRVHWEIDIEADSPVAAASQVWREYFHRTLAGPDDSCVFVIDGDEIDLSEIDDDLVAGLRTGQTSSAVTRP